MNIYVQMYTNVCIYIYMYVYIYILYIIHMCDVGFSSPGNGSTLYPDETVGGNGRFHRVVSGPGSKCRGYYRNHIYISYIYRILWK